MGIEELKKTEELNTVEVDTSDSLNQGIPLKKLNRFLVGVTLFISIVFLVVTLIIINGNSKIQNATKDFITWNKSANELGEGSNYLTEQVRLFAATVERQYLDRYFTEVHTTKRRDRAISTLGPMLSGTDAFKALQEARIESESLMSVELYSMRLMIQSIGSDILSYPQEIQRVELDEADLLLTAEGQSHRAREIVFSDDYQARKEIISSKITLCQEKLAETIESTLQTSRSSQTVLLLLQLLFSILLLVIILIMVIFTMSQVINPLLRAIPNVRDNRPIPVSGAHEFRFLAHTYNLMYQDNKDKKTKLDFNANHDELTGLLNRRGFKQVLTRIDIPMSALLIVDIDNFKGVNDNYGHDIGDRILVRIADELTSHFRSDDYIFRLGGDEFAIYMINTAAQKKEIIREKIQLINHHLTIPEDDLPYVSISAGVAFGEPHDDMDTLYKKADTALYQVKTSGKSDCAFYEKQK